MTACRYGPHAAGLLLHFGGADAVCRLSGALWLENDGALIVSDLHFEKGSSYATRGQMLPPFDTRETLNRLEHEVAALSPRLLIFLGDSFHDDGAEDRLCFDDAGRLATLAAGRALVWVVGNHDAEGPRALPGDVVTSLTVSAFSLAHEPAIGAARGEIAGHLHPCAKVRGRAGSVRRRCFVTDGERLILPAFGAYTGGLNIRDPAFARHMSGKPMAAVLGARTVHAVGWASLRGD